jgi:hypothetical protein
MTPRALRALQTAVHPACELALGMAVAQVIATLQVHASNLRLFESLSAVAAAGFATVPNAIALPGLRAWETAMAGGWLFTLTVGAAVALLTVAAAAFWCGSSATRRTRTVMVLGVWAGVLLLFNLRGFDPWASLYVAAVPPPVFLLDATRPRAFREENARLRAGCRTLPVLLLALAWSTQYDRGLFIDLRDHLLMSNPVGRKVSSFYYRYTLYPAEAFKRLDQKQIRTFHLTHPAGPQDWVARASAVLVRNDYLPVPAGIPADLGIAVDGERILFSREGRIVLGIGLERFYADPAGVLREISRLSDHQAIFRSFTFAGVLFAFPIALWIMLFAAVRVAAGAVFDGRRAELLAAAAGLLAGLGLLVGFAASREPEPAADGLSAALAAPRWQVRVAALKTVPERRVDIAQLGPLDALAASPYPQERYWLAQALSANRGPAASVLLRRLLEDPNLNVQTQAIEALARQGRRQAIGEILRRFETSPEWYVQSYAYRALKELGWQPHTSR